MGEANPTLAEAFWKIPSDFAETLNYGQLLLFSFFLYFFSPLGKCQE